MGAVDVACLGMGAVELACLRMGSVARIEVVTAELLAGIFPPAVVERPRQEAQHEATTGDAAPDSGERRCAGDGKILCPRIASIWISDRASPAAVLHSRHHLLSLILLHPSQRGGAWPPTAVCKGDTATARVGMPRPRLAMLPSPPLAGELTVRPPLPPDHRLPPPLQLTPQIHAVDDDGELRDGVH
jgi:hypothetical protein